MEVVESVKASFKKVNPRDEYKKRVKAIRNNLPKNYKQILMHHYPVYDNHKGSIYVQNVVACRATDVLVTNILERIANGELTLPAV